MSTSTTSPTADTIDGLVRRAVANAPARESLIDAPNRAAVFSGEPQRLTWSDLDAAIDAVGGALQTAGAGAGDTVAVQLPNVVELPITILACQRIGAVATPFPVQHREHELRYGFGASGATLFITGARPDREDVLSTALAVCTELDVSMLTFGTESIEGATPLTTVPNDPPATIVPQRAQPSDGATICWTSGTTGVPKGVPRTQAMWCAVSGFQIDELGLGPTDRILCPFPLVNMGGIGGMMLPWIDTGSTLILHHPIDLPVFLGQIAAEQITYTVAPPPLLNMLLRNDALLEGVDMTSIRAITSGSAPLDPWMVAGWEDRGIEIVNAFGSNEGASLLSTRASVPDPNERARFFPPPSTADVRLVDLDTGLDIEDPGVPGELRFRGSLVFDGYVDSDGAEFDEQGFFRSGDIFERATSATGAPLFRFVDRAKDIIIRGGTNISAAEIEALVSPHPSVAECAVVGYPDPDLGERVAVFVVAAPDTTPTLDAIVDHLREQQVASYKLPERLEPIDLLPRNPVGKVVKAELRQRLLESTEGRST